MTPGNINAGNVYNESGYKTANTVNLKGKPEQGSIKKDDLVKVFSGYAANKGIDADVSKLADKMVEILNKETYIWHDKSESSIHLFFEDILTSLGYQAQDPDATLNGQNLKKNIVYDFQKKNGLKRDGKLGRDTLKMIFNHVEKSLNGMQSKTIVLEPMVLNISEIIYPKEQVRSLIPEILLPEAGWFFNGRGFSLEDEAKQFVTILNNKLPFAKNKRQAIDMIDGKLWKDETFCLNVLKGCYKDESIRKTLLIKVLSNIDRDDIADNKQLFLLCLKADYHMSDEYLFIPEKILKGNSNDEDLFKSAVRSDPSLIRLASPMLKMKLFSNKQIMSSMLKRTYDIIKTKDSWYDWSTATEWIDKNIGLINTNDKDVLMALIKCDIKYYPGGNADKDIAIAGLEGLSVYNKLTYFQMIQDKVNERKMSFETKFQGSVELFSNKEVMKKAVSIDTDRISDVNPDLLADENFFKEILGDVKGDDIENINWNLLYSMEDHKTWSADQLNALKNNTVFVKPFKQFIAIRQVAKSIGMNYLSRFNSLKVAGEVVKSSYLFMNEKLNVPDDKKVAIFVMPKADSNSAYRNNQMDEYIEKGYYVICYEASSEEDMDKLSDVLYRSDILVDRLVIGGHGSEKNPSIALGKGEAENKKIDPADKGLFSKIIESMSGDRAKIILDSCYNKKMYDYFVGEIDKTTNTEVSVVVADSDTSITGFTEDDKGEIFFWKSGQRIRSHQSSSSGD